MARYEHLPIYKEAMDVAIYMEKIVVGGFVSLNPSYMAGMFGT